MQTKLLVLTDCQIKADGNSRKFSGYGSTFHDVDSYGDIVLPGAFKKTLRGRERPIRMRWNHFGPVIGIYTAIKEDQHGLYVEGELTPGHSVADNVHASMKHGAVDGLSIGYYPVKGEKNEHGGRNLSEIDLVEISIVEEPANVSATVSDVKSDADFARETSRQLESWGDLNAYLRNNRQWSRAEADALVKAVQRIAGSERRHGDVMAQIRSRLHGANATRRLFEGSR